MRNLGGTCEVCGGPIRIDNRYGICNNTLQCRRKKALVKYYRYHDRARKQSLEYNNKNRDEINRKDRVRTAASKHPEMTYLAWSPGLKLMKIGITTNLKVRIPALRTACPDVTLVGALPYGRELERYLHAVLAPNLRGGEWFDLGRDPASAGLRVLREVSYFTGSKRFKTEDYYHSLNRYFEDLLPVLSGSSEGDPVEILHAISFNVQGLLFEILKEEHGTS